ncbi:MAG: macro domain-containing protein, partial [Planctomycetes bacterium]|nr:macro domain-containing protein [Planctomycetota bacterium]
YGRDEPSEELLTSCYRKALQLAEENGIGSVAFPAISTGAFGYPMEEAGRIAIRTVFDALPELRSVERIRFVLFSERARRIHENVLEEMTGEGTGDR